MLRNFKISLTKRSLILNKVDRNIWEKKIPINYHIIFWVGYFSLNVLRWGSYYNDFFYSFKSNLVEFPIHIILSYFHAYYLIPKLVAKKKYVFYLLQLISSDKSLQSLSLSHLKFFCIQSPFIHINSLSLLHVQLASSE